jgi:cell wall assembly regulator SMI1
MDPVEAITTAQVTTLVDEDGDQVVLELAPALSKLEIEQLEAVLGVPLPGELRRLLQHTGGIDGALESIDFSGRNLDFEEHDIFPAGLPIAHDGFGNFWVLDLTPATTEQAPVFFACHDAPVILYQSPDLGHFLGETFRMYTPPHASLVDDVHEDRLFDVWRQNPGTLDHASALAGDEDMHAFASELGDRFLIVDLRSPEIGMGFSWGRYGPRTEVRRHGYERLFAYARPERQPGLLRRLSDKPAALRR